jgi:hypothetical protein
VGGGGTAAAATAAGGAFKELRIGCVFVDNVKPKRLSDKAFLYL